MTADAKYARLAGLMYLGTIVCGVFAEVFVRDALFVRGDAAATVHAIFASEPLFRFGLIADLAMLACYVVVTILLYGLFRKSSPYLRATAAAFSLIGIAVLACDTLLLAMVLRLRDLAQPSSSFAETAYLLLRAHGDGYKISLVFFGAYCLLLSSLIWRERVIPIAVGIMVAAAGACNVINSIAWLGAPEWAVRLPQYFTMPTLLGELAMALWLLIFGVREVEA